MVQHCVCVLALAEAPLWLVILDMLKQSQTHNRSRKQLGPAIVHNSSLNILCFLHAIHQTLSPLPRICHEPPSTKAHAHTYQSQQRLHANSALASCVAPVAITLFACVSSSGLNHDLGGQNNADWHGNACNTSRQPNLLDYYILGWFSREMGGPCVSISCSHWDPFVFIHIATACCPHCAIV